MLGICLFVKKQLNRLGALATNRGRSKKFVGIVKEYHLHQNP